MAGILSTLAKIFRVKPSPVTSLPQTKLRASIKVMPTPNLPIDDGNPYGCARCDAPAGKPHFRWCSIRSDEYPI